MLTVLCFVLFVWLFFQALRLAFKLAWCAAKVIAVILSVIALPMLAFCLALASGAALLLPVALIAAAWGLLKCCA